MNASINLTARLDEGSLDPAGYPRVAGDPQLAGDSQVAGGPQVAGDPPLACHPSLVRRGLRALPLLVILLAYSAFLYAHFAPAIIMPDDNGYFAQASLLTTTGKTYFTPESPAQYIGMHWLLTPDGKFVPRYPPGLSAMIAPLYAVFGWQAAVLVNPLLSLVALAGLYALARQLMPPLFAATATALLALNPTFTEHALAGDSHIAVTAALCVGCALLLRWSRTGSLRVALLAAAVLGIIPTVRYADSVMSLGFGSFILYTLAGQLKSRGWKSAGWTLAVFAIGIALPIAPMLINNKLSLGHFFSTGYTLSNESTGFSWASFKEHFSLYLTTLNTNGLGPLFGIGFLSIATLLSLKATRAIGLLLTGITLPMLLLYMAYYWGGMGGNGAGIMRFLLPTFPAYLLAAMYVLFSAITQLTAVQSQIGNRRSPLSRFIPPLVLAALTAVFTLPTLLPETGRTFVQRKNVADVTRAIDNVVPTGSVIITENDLAQQLDFVRKWKIADPSLARGGMGGMGMRGGPGGPGGMGGMSGRGADGANADDRPSPMQAAKARALREHYTGSLEARRTAFRNDVTAWAGSQKVYLVATEANLLSLTAAASKSDYKIIARIPLTKLPDTTQNAPFGGRGRGGFGGGGFGGGGFGGGFAGGPQGGPQGGPDGFGPPNGRGNGDGGPMAGGFFGGPGGGFGGRDGGRGPGGGGGGGGGGMMNVGAFNGASEVVIAELLSPTPKPTTQPTAVASR